MPRIFISYRRSDSRTFTDRIHDRLVDVFGAESVFQDVDDIPAGADFRVVLREAVDSCDVLLVMIGPQWAGAADAKGRKRLDAPADFVRIEVEAGLITGKYVIPVLIENAVMPNLEDLPEALHELAYRNAARIRHNPDFSHDMDRLVRQIKHIETELIQRRQAEEARLKAEAEEAERQWQAKLEAQAKEAEAERQRQADLAAQAKADEEARLKAIADEVERQRQAELAAQAKADEEARLKAIADEAERQRQADLEMQAKADEEARLKAIADEAERQRQAELAAQAKADEEARLNAVADKETAPQPPTQNNPDWMLKRKNANESGEKNYMSVCLRMLKTRQCQKKPRVRYRLILLHQEWKQ